MSGVFCSLLSAGAMIRACFKVYAEGGRGGGTFPDRGCFKMHTLLITPSCSASHDTSRSRGSTALTLQQRCAGPYAHSLTHTYIFIYAATRATRARNETAAASLIDSIIRPGNLCCSCSSSSSRESAALWAVITAAGCRSIRAATPPPQQPRTLAWSADGEAPPHKSGHFVTKESLTRCC